MIDAAQSGFQNHPKHTMPSLNDTLDAHCQAVWALADRLDTRADALSLIGLTALAQQLRAESELLHDSLDRLRQVYRADLQHTFDQSQAIAGNLLAMIALTPPAPKEPS